MKELHGEPVAEAEAVYNHGGTLVARWRCWRYYHEEQFWDARVISRDD